MVVPAQLAVFQPATDFDSCGPLTDGPRWYDAVNDIFVYPGAEAPARDVVEPRDEFEANGRSA